MYQQYVVSSLELHLFFSRIMKEHALFLRAGFTPKDIDFIRQAQEFQHRFEQLLSRVVQLSDCVVGPEVLSSGEVMTEFTLCAEKQTQHLTGIEIDQAITMREARLRATQCPHVTDELIGQVRQLNRSAIRLLDGLIAFKESILTGVGTCCMFTMNYPLLIEHILREANLYRDCLVRFESGQDFDCQNLCQAEQFWNQIMMEHALFIRGLLDPTENELIETSDAFAQDYATLLARARAANDKTLVRRESLQDTLKFRQFKTAGTEGIRDCNIRSIILPLLADHVLREANHYIRLLERD